MRIFVQALSMKLLCYSFCTLKIWAHHIDNMQLLIQVKRMRELATTSSHLPIFCILWCIDFLDYGHSLFDSLLASSISLIICSCSHWSHRKWDFMWCYLFPVFIRTPHHSICVSCFNIQFSIMWLSFHNQACNEN